MSSDIDPELFRHIVEQTGHGVYITDRDGTIRYVNPKFEDITGYTKDEALGKNPRILKSGEQPQEYYEDLWDTILSGETWEETIINKRKDGGLYYASQTIAPIKQNGEITHFAAIQTDTTEEVLERQQLDVLYRLLRHNLRTQLNLILLKIQGIEENVEERQKDRAIEQTEEDGIGEMEDIDEIIGEAQKIRRTVEDIRHTENIEDISDSIEDLERIANKTKKAKKILSIEDREITKIDIQNKLKKIKKDILERYPDSKINIEIDIENPIQVYTPLHYGLEELIENGIKHNNSETPTVDIKIRETSENIEIEISDNGPGIPKDEIKVLERKTETSLEHGSGLGLWIAYWTVDINRGQIEIKTKQKGTKIKIKLPLHN